MNTRPLLNAPLGKKATAAPGPSAHPGPPGPSDSPGKVTGLSLCMIVRNEAENLAECLDHHQPLVDEIVVVDTGSTDATREIALEHGARLSDFPWCDDFSAARNESLRQARYSWILVLDADERIHPEDFTRLRSLLSLQRFQAVFLNIENIDPNGALIGKHFAVRMFKALPQIRFRGAIHEQVAIDGKALCTNLRILHSGYRLNPKEMSGKLQRDKKLLEKSIAAEPRNNEYRYYLARTLYLLGEHEEGLVHAGPARADLEANGDLGALYFLTAHLEAALCLEEGEEATAERLCRRILSRRDDYLDVNLLLAKTCQQRGRLREARRYYRRFLELRPRFANDATAGFPFGMITSLTRGAEAHNELADLLHKAGDTQGGIAELEKAARLDPTYVPTYLNWGIALLAQGREAEAMKKFSQALEIDPRFAPAKERLVYLEHQHNAAPSVGDGAANHLPAASAA